MKRHSFQPVVAAAALILACTMAFAAPDTTVTIGLDEALAIARRNNRELHIAMIKQKAEREKVNQVWGRLFPILESEASLLRQNARTGFMSLADGQYDIRVVQLRFGLNPGVFYHALQTTRDAYRIASEDVRRIKMEIEFNVIKSYFDLLLAHELLQLRRETTALLHENLKDINNLYRSGSVPKYDVLQAQVRVVAADPLVIDAENRCQIVAQIFNYHLGEDTSRYQADRSVIDSDRFRNPSDTLDAETERLGRIALKSRPEIIQLTLKKQALGHQAKISQSQYIWPTFSIGGSYGYTMTDPGKGHTDIITPIGPARADLSQIAGDGKWQPNWQIRFAATYRWGSLFPFDTNRAEEREARTRVLEAEEELNRIKRLITISIKSSLSNLATAYRTIRAQKENISKSEEGLRIARESFRSGVIKNTELLAAQVSVAEAKTGYIHAINNYYVSLAQLQREVGAESEATIFGGSSYETGHPK